MRRPRLLERDRGVAFALLDGQLQPLGQRLQVDTGQQFAHLAQLVLVARGEDQLSAACS